MKILHVFNHSTPHVDGYAVRSEQIVRFQSALGLEPVVVTSPMHEPKVTGPVETIDGIRYYRTTPEDLSHLVGIRHYQASARVRARVADATAAERPDFVHAHSPCLWGSAACRAASRFGIPFVYEVRALWEDAAVDQDKTREGSLKYRFSRYLETRVLRKARAITTISEHLRAELIERGVDAARVFVVPNAVDAGRFSAGARDENLATALGVSDTVNIGYIGSLYEWEGVEDLVRSVPIIRARSGALPRGFKVLIVGGGAAHQRLEELVRGLGLTDTVRLTGHVPNAEIEHYYSLLDVIVYPRKRTRLTELVTPLKPLEAMAMAKAVVGSDVGGIKELVPEGTGLLFRAGDTGDLAAKCLELLEDPAQREALGKRARQHVLSDRDWANVVHRYLEVYNAVGGTNSDAIVTGAA